MAANILSSAAPPDEASRHYQGWRVVAVCFLMAVFCWGFGFYGQGVYLAELTVIRGWPVGVISGATTVYYLFSAGLVIFVGDAMARFGVKRVVLVGLACLGLSTALIAHVTRPWQLYADDLLMSFGWATMSIAAISTILGLWFETRRGLAISLALSGASFGAILVVPALIGATRRFGFAPALTGGALLMVALLAPMILAWIDEPRRRFTIPGRAAGTPAPATTWTRKRALRSFAFWTVVGPFAFALLAQAAFLVHQIAFLAPRVGAVAAGFAVALTAVAALTGRLTMGAFIDRLNPRRMAALSFLSQALALLVMIAAKGSLTLMIACAVFGVSVGNVITLPALIIHREFEAAAFALLIGFATAIVQFTYSFGPGMLGVLRDATGGYGLPLLLCVALEVLAAGAVLVRRPA